MARAPFRLSHSTWMEIGADQEVARRGPRGVARIAGRRARTPESGSRACRALARARHRTSTSSRARPGSTAAMTPLLNPKPTTDCRSNQHSALLERQDCTLVAWYRSLYAPRTGGAYDSRHRTAGIAGCTRRRGRVAARGSARAQAMRVVGFLGGAAPAGYAVLIEAFRSGL